ncbi:MULTISPECIES: PAS domain-containing sensor histidine kinase [unclassified Halanaerobium]|uniref:PAS domain-containing sensor histidine kinase n=1 Tax=unclassified Halanaerobium TaxID=2641197 RepID=UPI000E15F6D2|nr:MULTISPECIES: PAS domain-containing sensor histidine kinase [unclassified Halanaerobium]RCW41828.1 PAS domain S-box-containing protein [Halanaerobium sp. MA284_MarDTE_T2]RCW88018.1 PAS domain S-box-containing protein [Halanaerobium sp. DL-01]
MKISPEHSFLFQNINHIAYYLIDMEHFGPVNQMMADICNLSKEDIEYQHISAFFNDKELKNLKKFHKKLFEQGEEKNVCRSFVRDSGEERFFEVKYIPHKNNSEKVDYILCLAEDITKKLAAKKKIKAQKEVLKDNELRTRFFTNVSHELKTPLNLIFSTLQVIDYYKKQHSYLKNDKRLDKYLNLIKQNGFRLLRLANNLIDIIRIGADSFKINRGNYDIIFVIKGIIESVSDFIDSRDRMLKFSTDIKSKIIACDPFNIERVMLNLLSNAVKFTEAGDEITVSVEEKEEKIVISVRDTGIGIKEEEREVIFEQFRQINKSFNKQQEGSGIGLSLVKSIIEMHNGKVWVESKFGEYSQFSFYLPDFKVIKEDNDSEKYKADNLFNKVDLEFSDI